MTERSISISLLLRADSMIFILRQCSEERRLENGTRPESNWWNNSGWVTNISRFDSVKKPYFLPTKVREFQISRARFPGKEWKMMVEVMTPAEPNRRTVAYPPGAKNTDTNGWVVLKFE
jgi:hypothetical protein